ncbi:unnamed protein product [Oncorhynchus mykiss]|uniref:PH domain-containing protein n=1 Tax=Oncorhynchus mykiss TaxID=8022 RepID=A0A060XAQ5_ONCMY|nr:unnamed protein product [Oncorhynchus mykiss]
MLLRDTHCSKQPYRYIHAHHQYQPFLCVCQDSSSLCSQRGRIMKQGWLQKANINSSLSVSMRVFKRRYFYLSQLPDGSYILNSYKDEKKCKDTKGSIYLYSCIDVIQCPKIRRNGFELKMQERFSHFLAADSEEEMEGWVITLKHALQSSTEGGDRKNGGDSLDCALDEDSSSQGKGESLLESLGRSLHPELIKYARETDQLNKLRTLKHRLARQKLKQEVPILRTIQRWSDQLESTLQDCFDHPYWEMLRVSCHDLPFSLQGCVSERGDGVLTNTRSPTHTHSLSHLPLLSRWSQISSDFHVDLNPPPPLCTRDADRHLPTLPYIRGRCDAGNGNGLPILQRLSESLLRSPTQGIFSVTNPHADIFLVARMEKVLQNGITHCAEPYINQDLRHQQDSPEGSEDCQADVSAPGPV